MEGEGEDNSCMRNVHYRIIIYMCPRVKTTDGVESKKEGRREGGWEGGSKRARGRREREEARAIYG